jgi:hypothetical protein
MRTLSVSSLLRRSISLLLCASLGCDTLDVDKPENLVKFSQTEFYILPASSTIIDLRTVIKKSFVRASLTISENPVRGTLMPMDAFVFKYTPNIDFVEGKDRFVISAVLDDGTTIKSEPMTVHMKSDDEEFPCGVYAVEDNIRIDSSSTVVIHVLKNDRVCGVDEPVNVLVHLAPKFGDAVVAGDSIVYTPGPLFSKHDEFVYSLSTSSGGELSFGLVTFNNSKFEIFEIPGGATNIFFVDDMIGFIAGEVIQKTIDGGRHWIQLTYPAGEDEYVAFEDICFLDKDHGFAAFSAWSRSNNDLFFTGGWMMTKNGGVSWDRFDLKEPVSSIVFTSPLIGYISTYSLPADIVFPEDPEYRSVFKTVDGGETWDQVGEMNTSSVGKGNLRFATDNVGWAYQNQHNAINSTTDGGKTWEVFFTSSNVTSLALASDNVICASIAPDGPPVATPGAIVRSENGSPFQTVINFPYTILSQGFSPEGDLGVAIGIRSPNPTVSVEPQILTISKSTDNGETWVDLDLTAHLDRFPWDISVPSANVAYILCSGKIIKYTP